MTETFGLTLNCFRRVLRTLDPKVTAQPSNRVARQLDRSAHAWLRNCQKQARAPHFGTACFDEQKAWRMIVDLRRALGLEKALIHPDDRVDALRRAIEGATFGDVALSVYGQWVSAHAGPDGCLVQMNANGTFHVDGEFAGEIPADLQERVALLIASVEEDEQEEQDQEESLRLPKVLRRRALRRQVQPRSRSGGARVRRGNAPAPTVH